MYGQYMERKRINARVGWRKGISNDGDDRAEIRTRGSSDDAGGQAYASARRGGLQQNHERIPARQRSVGGIRNPGGPARISADEAQWAAFMAALDMPPTDNPRLRKLLATRAPWDPE
jgi:hypothetical protein